MLKRTNSRSIFFLVPVLLFLFLLPSCQTGEKITLKVRFFGTGEYPEMVKRVTAEWLKEHPNVRLELDYVPWGSYTTKLQTEFAGGVSPDIGWIENSMSPLILPKGMFIPLNSFLSNDDSFRLDGYWPAMVDQFRYGENLFCIPSDVAPTACVFYNKQMFEQAGLPFPKDNWDWNEFVEIAKKLTLKDAEGKVTQWGFFTDYYSTFVYSSGGAFVDNLHEPKKCTINSPAAIRGLQFFLDLAFKHQVMPVPVGENAALNDMGMEQKFMFKKVAMVYTGIWISEQLREGIKEEFDWDIALPPRFPGKAYAVTPSGGSGWGIFKHCKHPELAWELVKILTGAEAQKELAKFNIQPALISLAKEKDVWGYPPQPANKQALNQAMEHVVFSPRSEKWNQVEQTVISPEFHRLWTGKSTVPESLRRIEMEADKILRE